jgi:hypothetical protein
MDQVHVDDPGRHRCDDWVCFDRSGAHRAKCLCGTHRLGLTRLFRGRWRFEVIVSGCARESARAADRPRVRLRHPPGGGAPSTRNNISIGMLMADHAGAGAPGEGHRYRRRPGCHHAPHHPVGVFRFCPAAGRRRGRAAARRHRAAPNDAGRENLAQKLLPGQGAHGAGRHRAVRSTAATRTTPRRPTLLVEEYGPDHKRAVEVRRLRDHLITETACRMAPFSRIERLRGCRSSGPPACATSTRGAASRRHLPPGGAPDMSRATSSGDRRHMGGARARWPGRRDRRTRRCSGATPIEVRDHHPLRAGRRAARRCHHRT